MIVRAVAEPTRNVSTATNTEELAVVEPEHVVLSSDEPESGNLFAALNCMPMVLQSNFTVPSKAICLADDDIALHVPSELCIKTWKGEYVNLAKLLRRELRERASGQGSKVTINEQGTLELLPKSTKQISNIHEWTDAFLIYMYIITKKKPGKARELIQYKATIREAESRSGSNDWWKIYDENFRLRQAVTPMPWGKIHVDLRLKAMCLSAPITQKAPVSQSTMINPSTFNPEKNICHECNSAKGCRFPNCKYAHICLVCRGGHAQTKCNQKIPPFRE